MKKSLIVGTVALSLFCASFCLGQEQPQTPAAPHMAARIQLSTKTPQSKYRGDEDIFLDLSLENTGTTNLDIRATDISRFYQIELTGPTGKVEPLPAFTAKVGMVSGGWRILPGGQKRAYIWLNRAFDLSKVGTYTVSVSTKLSPKEGPLVVTSQPFSFDITSSPTVSGWS